MPLIFDPAGSAKAHSRLRRTLACRRRILWARASIALSIACIIAGIARADAPELATQHLTISAVNATASDAGSVSRLRFTLTNDGPDNSTLLGVQTSVSDVASIVARLGERMTTHIPAVSVPAGESLNLDCASVWIELRRLKRPLVTGELFSVIFRFVTGEVAVEAHIHSADALTSEEC